MNDAQSRTEPPSPQPERKQVSMLFCDVVDYTSRSVELDPEYLADDIRAFQKICSAAAEKYHGHIANYLGDGLLVLFGYPTASEFDAEHAVHAGMEMVATVKRNNESAEWRKRKPIRIRIGIATGLVVVERAGDSRDRDELIFGETPNLAARLQGVAEPDSVVTALRTRQLVGRMFKFRHLGKHDLKGFVHSVNVWQILHPSSLRNRSTAKFKRATPFVGRQVEMDFLRENFQCALGGQSRIIHIQGEPGIGKSRLLRRFERKVLTKDDQKPLRVACSPYFRNTPFKPIIDETHRWLRLSENDTADAKREKIHKAMGLIDLAGGDEHSLFNELLDIPPTHDGARLEISADEKRRLTVEALAGFVFHMARKRPLLLVVEDLHWADPSTLEVLGTIIARAGQHAKPNMDGEKLFAILTSRNEFISSWAAGKHFAKWELCGLGVRESARLVATVEGARDLPVNVRKAVVRKSGGVPLFLEETSLHLVDQLPENEVREDDVEGFYTSMLIPDTLQDSLNARLDQLGAGKAFAQLASVFGGDFRYSMIAEIAAQNNIDAYTGLEILENEKVLSRIEGENESEDRYQFCHALFRDAAYHSLLKKTRRRYHLQIVELLQKDDPGIVHTHPELLAEHYAQTECIDRAIDLWLQAGKQAIKQNAVGEAIKRLSNGLELTDAHDDDGERKLELLLDSGAALTESGGYNDAQVAETYERAFKLAKAIGRMREMWTALYGQWRCRVSQGKFRESVRVAMRLKSLSEKSGDPKRIMTACGLQGMTRTVAGHLASAEPFYDRAVALYDGEPDMGVWFGQDPYLTIRGLGAVNKLWLDKIPQSIDEIEQSVAAARKIGRPYTVAETLRVAAMYWQIAGDFAQLRTFAEETVSLAKKYGFEGLLAAGNIFLAFCDAVKTGTAGKSRVIRQNLNLYEKKYGKLFLPYFRGVRAEARLLVGDYKGAMKAAADALKLIDQYGEKCWQPHLLGIKAETAAKGNLAKPAEIAAWREDALSLAKLQQAQFTYRRLVERLG